MKKVRSTALRRYLLVMHLFGSDGTISGRGFALTLLFSILSCVLVGCSNNNSGDSSDSTSVPSLDLASVSTDLIRVHGSTGNGSVGVPVAGGFDVDGDGDRDIAFAAMRAASAGRAQSGEIFLVFGDGTIEGTLDTAVDDARILHILGSAAYENAGSEIWMDDVTGDGIGDLLIARQNYDAATDRVGAGAVSILVGGSALATHAATLTPIDLAAPPMGITITTLVGGESLGRLGVWLRTGDVTGDGVADLLVGADQENSAGEADSGAVYLVRGGAHLGSGTEIDFIDFGATTIAGHLAKITPPAGSVEYHFGATCQLADLDGNGRAEVLVAATLNRAGATLQSSAVDDGSAHGGGGATDGALYIAWDDNFLANPWTDGYAFAMDAAPASTSTIMGGVRNVSFGEEILGGLDFDDDGTADLFVGDIVGDATASQSRRASGSGHLLYNAASLKNEAAFTLDAPPAGLVMTTFVGPESGDIASDTALQGDFDGDGFPDLAFSSPHGSPRGRGEAGIIHVVHGQSGVFPARIDLRNGRQPDPSEVRLIEVHGVKSGDVLCYSAASTDHDADGIDDLVVNEMLGDGLQPGTANTGNLIVISGELIQGVE